MNKRALYEANMNLQLEDLKKSASIAWDELDKSHAARAMLHDELIIAEGQRDQARMRAEKAKAERGVDTGLDCAVCTTRIYETMIGAGDGAGQKFAHPESETSPIRKHTKALGEVSYALEALEKENLELKHQINELQLQVGDWKDVAEQTIAAARGTRLDAAGERQLRELVEERAELCKTVAFFASVIKSGESWSDTCQTMYNNTIIHLPSRK